MSNENVYIDSCPECDSLDVRVFGDRIKKTSNMVEIEVRCQECGASWFDYLEGE